MSEVSDPKTSILDPDLASMLEIPEGEEKDFVFCAACSHVITRSSLRTVVNGSHDHHFTNPHGFSFHVGCFAQALGCDISGAKQAADTWFMGYQWNVADCSQCHRHLGWYFSANTGTHDFYGLILDRIQDDAR